MGSGPEHMSHRNSPGIPLELREEHSLTRRFAHLMPARNRLGLVLLKARPEVQEDRTCFHPVDLPAQPSPPPVPPPAPPRHHQNQPQSKTRGCLQLCHLPAANPRTGALLMILTARNTTRLIFFFFFSPSCRGLARLAPNWALLGQQLPTWCSGSVQLKICAPSSHVLNRAKGSEASSALLQHRSLSLG